MTHPLHSEAWKHFDSCHPSFASYPCNIRLSLCMDSFNPFVYSAKSTSVQTIIITIYNLSLWMCMTRSFMLLSLLILGKDRFDQNIVVYLRFLLDDLKLLQANRLRHEIFYKDKIFICGQLCCGQLIISQLVEFYLNTHGRLSWPICMRKIKPFCIQHFGKPCWFDCHEHHLPPNHSFKWQRK